MAVATRILPAALMSESASARAAGAVATKAAIMAATPNASLNFMVVSSLVMPTASPLAVLLHSSLARKFLSSGVWGLPSMAPEPVSQTLPVCM